MGALGGMPSTRPTSAPKLTEKAQRRVDRLVGLYEREAYGVYNLALRTCAEPAAAARATEAAFLRYLPTAETTGDEAEQRPALLKEAVAAALAEPAPRPGRGRPAKSLGRRLLRANATLSGPERAAIALDSLGEGTADAIAAATETTRKAATALSRQARRGLAQAAKIPPDELDVALADWPWAEPPAEIWDSLYPRAHRLLTELEADTAKPKRRSSARHSPLAERTLRGPGLPTRVRRAFSGAGGVWAFRVGLLAIVLLPAAVVAMTGGGESTTSVALSATGPGASSFPTAPGSGASSGGSTYDALTPKELDQLRLEELDALRRYSRAQADKSLSAGERTAAEQEAQELLALARQRLDEAERREQQAAAREKKSKARPAPAPPETTPKQPASGKKGKKKKKSKRRPPPSSPSIEDCLFDEESGTYICPE